MSNVTKVQPQPLPNQSVLLNESFNTPQTQPGLQVKPDKSVFGTPLEQRTYKANIWKLCVFTFVIGLGNIQTGFAISGNNQTAPVIKAKFGWTPEEATLYNTIISSAAIFGVVAGSLAGGKFITKGRRLALIIFNVFAAMATALTMIENLTWIIIGRFAFGFCCGVFSVAGPKMLDETVPIHLNSSFGTATNTFLSGGIMIALLLGVILPDNEVIIDGVSTPNTSALEADLNWRVIYGFPFICQALTLLMFMTCFREDSIVYTISIGDDEAALSLIKKVYDPREDPEEILNDLKGKQEKGSSDVTLGQACCDKKYRTSTWVAFVLCFFQQQTGLDGIMIYSNTIFQQMYDKGAISLTGKQGSYLVGCVNWGGALLSPIPLVYYGRKTLLFWGQLSMGVSLVMIAVFQILDYSIPIIVMICVFILSFQFSQGPIAWMYAAEVAVDTALGLCVLALFLSLLEKAITMEFMVHSAMGAEGMFFLLGGITLLGAVFIKIFVKETKGLSDLQKKQLYMPVEYLTEKEDASFIKTDNFVSEQPLDDLKAQTSIQMKDLNSQEQKKEGRNLTEIVEEKGTADTQKEIQVQAN